MIAHVQLALLIIHAATNAIPVATITAIITIAAINVVKNAVGGNSGKIKIAAKDATSAINATTVVTNQNQIFLIG